MQIDHPILQFKNVSISYTPGKNAVNHVNADIKKNRTPAIMGPSGCGKSTLLRAINRMHELYPDIRISGEILMDNRNILKMNPMEVRRMAGMVFQRPNPFPTMSIFDNVIAVYKLNGIRLKKKEKEEQRKKEEEKKRKEEAEKERIRKEEAEKKRLAEERRKKEQAISNKVAGAFGIGSQEGNSQGDTGSGTGNQGSPFGNSDHGANEGVGGYGSFNLNGRSIGAGGLPRPAYTIQEEGRIVINITVDPKGNVIFAEIGKGTNIDNGSMRKSALDAAKRAKFNSISGANNQSGTITYLYKLK